MSEEAKEIIELFATSLKELGRAIDCDDRNPLEKHRAVLSSNKHLDEIIKIVSK